MLSNPTNAPERMNRILLVSTTNVSPLPPEPPPPPPLNPGRPSRTPFLPDPPAPKPRFMGLLGSQFGGSNAADGPDSALAPPPPPGEEGLAGEDDEGPACGALVEFVDEVPDDEIGGGLAESVTLVPSNNRSRACWTPSPPTSLPPPHEPRSPPPLRANLSISSMCMMPILHIRSVFGRSLRELGS